MAETTPVATTVTTLPSDDTIERASKFTREPFVSEGEDPAAVLAPGTAHRRAFDAALTELDAGARVPSVAWRRQWSLLLGLERLLIQDEPTLADGTVLSAHQLDALSGTLTALLAEAQRNGNGNGAVSADDAVQLAPVGIPGEEELEEDEPDEPMDWEDPSANDEQLAEAPEDPNAGKRFWFEHATGAGKTVAALGFVEASRTGGVLILTHRRNLVDQFHGELRDRGYAKRIAPALLTGQDRPDGPVTVETYQWFVRNAGRVSDAYTIVICDEAHTALGEKTSASIRQWSGPVFIGMTATGALIARHVTDLFPTQTSRFDLAQAARRGVISPLRCVRIPPGPGVRTIAKVPLRRGEVDTEFDQEMLAELLDQLPFNLAVADLYRTRFNGVPGVVYAAGVRHAYNLAAAFRDVGLKTQAVSGETPKRQLAEILAHYERGDIDVLVNAQLLAEGWNSPRATVCMHLAPTASKRIYQQRVGRVTRRQPGKEAGIVVDFVHPATKHDDPVVTLHSLLDRDVYRGGAIVVGPVRRGRGRRLRVERRVLPVTADENRRIEVFERELWRIAVEHLDYGEQVQWAALAGARVAPTGWRRARAMLHFDSGGELKRTFLTTAVERNKNPQLRLKALQEISAGRDAEAFDRALDFVETWPRDDKREGVKVVLQALAEKKIGRRDQANNWIWRCANMTREVHEEYAVQRWPETKRLLGLLVNSSGGAHARNARRLVHAARQQDRRLAAALLAAALPHTAEAGEVVNGARTRMSRKPAALARELLRNFPKGKGKSKRRRRRKATTDAPVEAVVATGAALEPTAGGDGASAGLPEGQARDAATAPEPATAGAADQQPTDKAPRRRTRRRKTAEPTRSTEAEPATADAETTPATTAPKRRTRRRPAAEPTPSPEAEPATAIAADTAADAETTTAPKRRTRRRPAAEPTPSAEVEPATDSGDTDADADTAPAPKRRSRRTAAEPVTADESEPPKRRTRRTTAEPVTTDESEAAPPAEAPKRRARRTAAESAAPVGEAESASAEEAPKRRSRKAAAPVGVSAETPKPRTPRKAAEAEAPAVEEAPKRRARSKTAAAASAETPKPRARRRISDVLEAAKAEAAPVEEAPKRRTRSKASDAASAETPKPRTRRKTAAASGEAKPVAENGAPNPLEAASERVRAAVRGASKRPAGDEAA